MLFMFVRFVLVAACAINKIVVSLNLADGIQTVAVVTVSGIWHQDIM